MPASLRRSFAASFLFIWLPNSAFESRAAVPSHGSSELNRKKQSPTR
ncbi:unnamed protein product [Protopolystoma xenopodis]|uniref:Uncharacterized protein n=1 Tax=Protopolystoma xenopodis TaxID=117903 RepID=A0A448XHG6_9PLAT|nr:unnamed protein product [Protopolystoma xenopodis]